MQKEKDAQHHQSSTPQKKKTWQRDLKMMKALKGTKTPKENIENGKDKFKIKAKQKSLHYFT
jgi:hypothetical protein